MASASGESVSGDAAPKRRHADVELTETSNIQPKKNGVPVGTP
jgi:hypothetical protein